jgi:alcohol dehydrogenase, propanol-preferring
MKAARVTDDGVRVVDLAVPEPGPDQALVRISSAGVCHSDLHLARGDWKGVGQSGLIGHEAIGIVEELGPGADRFINRGDRVILGLGGTGGGYWCGACEYCLGGSPRHCAQGKGIMGTFAEQFAVYTPSLVVLPDELSDLEAPLACGGLTAYGAVKKLLKHQIRPGRPVAVIGAAGGLGHYAVQIASNFGYEVVGVDVGSHRLDFVRSLGASLAVEPQEAVSAVEPLGGVGAALVFTAKMAGFDLGLKMLRKGGLFVAVGLPPTDEGNLELNPFQFFFKDPTLIYSAVGTVQDMRELVDLTVRGKVHSHVSRVGPLSELDTIFDELQASRYLGRAVIDDLAH